jgi:hypothetical protein
MINILCILKNKNNDLMFHVKQFIKKQPNKFGCGYIVDNIFKKM